VPTITDPIGLLLDENGDLVVTADLQFSSGLDAIAQGIRIRILTFRGEWKLNLDTGVPYYQDLLGQRFDQVKAHAAFRNAISSTPGVSEISSLAASFNGRTRTMSVSWSVQTIFGPVADSVEI